MHIYIDDSGDSGFAFDSGSTRFMVMAACLFNRPEDIEAASAAVQRCKEMNRQSREFKYAKTRDGIRDCFFRCTAHVPFAVRAIVIDKATLRSSHLRTHPRDLKSFAIKQLLTHGDGFIHQAKVFVDGQDTRAFQMSDARYFTRNVNRESPGSVSQVTFVDSKHSSPIQIADMVAGAIHRFVREDEKHSDRHFNMFPRRLVRPLGGSFWRYR